MNKGIFITGTDTGVGKTIITCGLVNVLKQKGINTIAMKPICTGGRKDIEFLIKNCIIKEDIDLINQYSFNIPSAPYVASEIEKTDIKIENILSAFNLLKEKYDIVIVEGIGGLLVPIKKNYCVCDLIKELNLPVIIVSRAKLGTINHTLLSIEYTEFIGIDIIGIIMNNSKNVSIAEKTNPDIIKQFSDVQLLGVIPHIDKLNKENITSVIKNNISIKKIENYFKKKKINYELKDKKYIWHPFTQMSDWIKEKQIIIKEAKGNYLKDIQGKLYFDGVSSLWVNVHGHRKKEIDKAIIKQINSVSHSTLLGLGNIPSIELAEKLVKIVPEGLKKVFYSDNGSTAVEISLKIAFQYWQLLGNKSKTKFVSFINAYHGDTIGSVSVGGIELFHKIYKPLLFKSFKVAYPYCYRCIFKKTYLECNFECFKQCEEIIKKYHNRIAGVIIEPVVQAASGMLVSPFGFLKKVRELCDEYNILLIADEVATGFGKTGKMFACNYENVSPDILCLAKSLSGGYLPVAATLTTEKIFDVFKGPYESKKTFFHGHTYTGNPLSCAAAIENLNIFEKENIIEKIQPKIKFLHYELKKFENLKNVGDVRQKGFMVGIELVKNKETKQPYEYKEKIGIKVCQELRKKGIILRPLSDVIVFMPPLSVTISELEKFLNEIYNTIKNM